MDNGSSSKHQNHNVPKIRFPGFEGEWERVKLSDYCDFLQGLTYKPEDVKKDGTLVLRSSNIQNSVLCFNDNVYVSSDMIPSKISTKSNDVLMCVRNGSRNLVGKTALISQRYAGLAWGAFMNILRPHKNNTFLYFFLNSRFFRNQIDADLDTATVKQITIGTLNGVEISIPHELEQEKIATFLLLLDERITKQRELIEKLKTYKRGVLERLLIPKPTWEKTTFGESCNDFSYGMNAAAKSFDGKHKYIRITDIDDSSHLYIQDEIVSPNSIPEEKYRVQIGDILFARTGASVGKSYIYLPSDGELYYAGFLIRVSVKKEYDCRFVYYQTLSKKYEKWVQLTSARSGQPGINAEEYKSFEFYAPDLSEQQRIADLLTKIDTYINMQAKQLDVLSSLKSALLQQMFI